MITQIIDGWLKCPKCSKNIMKISPCDTVNSEVYCFKCKTAYQAVIAKGKVYEMLIDGKVYRSV